MDLAHLAEELADHPDRERTRASAVSARNRLPGIITRVTKDTVMAQVDMICGPHRMVSLMSTEAAEELGLEPGRASHRVRQVHQRRRGAAVMRRRGALGCCPSSS